MPDCLIRDGLKDSSAVCALSDWSYRVYTLLIISADFAGRFDGRMEYLHTSLFPLGNKHALKEVGMAMEEITAQSLLMRYTFGGKPYLQLGKITRRFNTETALYPWTDGSYTIEYIDLPAPGRKEPVTWVKTSIFEEHSIPSSSHQDAIGIPSPCPVSLSSSLTSPSPNSGRARGVEIPEELNTPEFGAAWAEYVQHRNESRNKLTPTAIRGALGRMTPWGPDRAIAAMRHSIAQGWRGIFEPENGKVNTRAEKTKKEFKEDLKL